MRRGGGRGGRGRGGGEGRCGKERRRLGERRRRQIAKSIMETLESDLRREETSERETETDCTLTSPQFFGLFNSLSSLSREIDFENNPSREDDDRAFVFITGLLKRTDHTSNPVRVIIFCLKASRSFCDHLPKVSVSSLLTAQNNDLPQSQEI
jgi:hypothetical protein